MKCLRMAELTIAKNIRHYYSYFVSEAVVVAAGTCIRVITPKINPNSGNRVSTQLAGGYV